VLGRTARKGPSPQASARTAFQKAPNFLTRLVGEQAGDARGQCGGQVPVWE
jgi:hypothetical protein